MQLNQIKEQYNKLEENQRNGWDTFGRVIVGVATLGTSEMVRYLWK